MGMRFKFLAGLYLLALLVANHGSGLSPYGGISDVFVGLGSLLVFAVIGLWPNSSRADRVDRALSGSSWADRVEFQESQRD